LTDKEQNRPKLAQFFETRCIYCSEIRQICV